MRNVELIVLDPDIPHSTLRIPHFRERVWAVVRSVPPGKVVTYGQVAALLGAPRAARAVGTVLYNTPSSAEVPCQRVVNRWGRLAPPYGTGGMEQHKVELEAEGVEVRQDYTVDLAQYQWQMSPGDLPAES